MKKIIFALILLIKAAAIKADDSLLNNFNLNAGLSLNLIEMRTNQFLQSEEEDDDEGELEDEINNLGAGFYSSINYRFIDWEFGMFSDFAVGVIKDTVTFSHNGSSITGKGHFRLINLGPQIKYHTDFHLFNKAKFYIGFGPSWSLQTFVFKGNSESTGSFDARKRISFENYGATFLVGLQEMHKTKKEMPWFLEFVYSFMLSQKVSINDATDLADVITLSEGDSNDFKAHYFMFRFGVTLF